MINLTLRVYDISDDDAATDDGGGQDSNSLKFGKSIINALVIIIVLACFTFVLVFCYYMRCMKVRFIIMDMNFMSLMSTCPIHMPLIVSSWLHGV